MLSVSSFVLTISSVHDPRQARFLSLFENAVKNHGGCVGGAIFVDGGSTREFGEPSREGIACFVVWAFSVLEQGGSRIVRYDDESTVFSPFGRQGCAVGRAW